MRIGFDFDSVITDSRKLKSEQALKLYGKNIPYQTFKWDPVVTTGILTEAQYRVVQRAVHWTPEIASRMEEIDGALYTIAKLQREGHDLQIITARDGGSADMARSWLQVRKATIPLVGVGKVSKAPACAGLDMFVDDDLDVLEKLVGVVPNIYLFNHEYNSQCNIDGIARRVMSWQHIYETASALSRAGVR